MIRSQTWSRAIAVTAAQLNVKFTSDGASRVKGDLADVGQSVGRIGGQSRAVGAGLLGMGAGIAAGFGVGVKAAMSFEQGMANVQSVSGATAAEFADLSDAALRIGKDTSFSANEATLAIEELSKAGVSVENILVGAADGATALAAATGTELPQAAAAVATSLNVFSLSGDQATRVANVFAAGANKAATDVGQLQAGLAQGGAVFAMYGMTVEESVGALALFSDYGIQGSDAATSMKAALTTMNSGVGASAKEMANLGIEMYNANGEFVGMDGLAAELQRTLGGLSEEERNLALTRLGGTDGMRALNILYQEGAAGVDDYTAAVTGTEAATSAAAIRMDTLSGAMEALKGSVETLMIVFLSGLLPGIRVVVDAVTGFTNFLIDLPGPVQNVIVGLTALAGVVATLGGVFLLFGPQIAAALGLLKTLSFTGLLGGLAPVLGPLALAGAAAAGLYLAYKTNFLGIRDVVDNAMEPIRRFAEVFKASFANLQASGQIIQTWGSAIGGAVGYGNRFSNVLAAIGMGLRGMTGGRDIGWINALANGLDRAAGFVQRFKDAWDDLSGNGSMFSNFFEQTGQAAVLSGNKMAFAEKAVRALDIASGGLITRLREMSAIDFAVALGSIAVSIGGWAISAAVDLGVAVYDWITGTAIPAIGRAAQDVGDFAVRIGGWLVSAATDVWEAVKQWVMGGGVGAGDGTGGAGGGQASIPLGTVAAKITDWLVTAAIDIGLRVLAFVQTAKATITRVATDIGRFAVKIADWTVTAAIDIGQRVLSFVQGAKGTITRIATDIGRFAVKIADWTVDQAINLGLRVFSWIQGTAIPAITRTAFDLGVFAVKIA
ncbi:MAG: phage tail tape measure protein, partial [Chloroflexota bacterium]|nr:phage tail tape measure protein [Chloroflexota bacterium]